MKVLLLLGLIYTIKSIGVIRLKRKKQDSFDSLVEEYRTQQTKGMDENGLYRLFRTIGLTYGECKYIYNLIDIDRNKEIG